MAKVKKIKHLIRVDEDDDTFIIMHSARIGGTYQSFVAYAIKKEIKSLQAISIANAKRKSKNQ